jgi:hypothetical protein
MTGAECDLGNATFPSITASPEAKTERARSVALNEINPHNRIAEAS